MAVQRFELETRFDHPVREVWPLVSNTDLMNRLAGLNPAVYREEPGADGTPRLRATTRISGFELDYEERRFDWVEAHAFDIERIYSSGPTARYVQRLEVIPDTPGVFDAGGCRVVTWFELEPRGVLSPLVPVIFRAGTLASFRKVLATIRDELRAGRTANEIVHWPPKGLGTRLSGASPEEARRIHEAVARARDRIDSPLLERLETALVELPAQSLHRMRPIAFAREWRVESGEVVNLFLDAVHEGLLRLRWDVLCPHCRGDRQNLHALNKVPQSAFCAACDIDFDLDLTRSLEAVFESNPGLRESDPSKFCLAGPGSNAHVNVQQSLAPGERREIPLTLGPGRYRLRADAETESPWFKVEDGDAAGEVRLTDEGFEGDVTVGRQSETVSFVNERSTPARLQIQHGEWLTDALSAGELIATQRYRDHFSHEALAPGVQLSVERITILFTDLISSTEMYERLGDAKAFRVVWDHFGALEEVLEATGGALVKTIGDAVMAAFSTPERAAVAALRMQAEVDAHCSGEGWAPRLKIGFADGPALVVNLNGRLDYFGGTVNLAARVQGKAGDGAVLVARHTVEHMGGPEVFHDAGWKSVEDTIEAKGFDEAVSVVRFLRGDPEGP